MVLKRTKGVFVLGIADDAQSPEECWGIHLT